MSFVKDEPKPKKLYVVLGMHRSGTSAVTRGLKMFGIWLGDRLMPPSTGDNEKGFYEDLDIYELNVEILKFLGYDWDSLLPIEEIHLESLLNNGYFLRAVNVLRQKFATSNIFGLKDPRMAKLLPFWKQVFIHCQYDVEYILVLRNPLSVAKSLERRNGFDHEKSYILWVEHVLSSVLHTEESRRVLVDYDRLMLSPEREMKRIAQALSLQPDPMEMKHYKSEFLDDSLRHTVFKKNDLFLDNSCPPIVREIYNDLLEVAEDRRTLDDIEVKDNVHNWNIEYTRHKSNLRIIDRYSKRLTTLKVIAADRDREMSKLNQEISNLELHIVNLNDEKSERDKEISDLNQKISSFESQTVNLSDEKKEQGREISKLTEEIAGLKSQIHILESNNSHQAHVASLENAVFDKELKINNLEIDKVKMKSELDSILGSRSWRATAPMRRIVNLTRSAYKEFRKSIAKMSKGIYHALPISNFSKRRLKAIIFKLFAFALSGTAVYQRWKLYDDIKSTGQGRIQFAKQTTGNKFNDTTVNHTFNLPNADGKWEWEDYHQVQARIREIKNIRQKNFSDSSIPLIEVKNDELEGVASKIILPDPGERPKVSIIIPVFNEIKTTLECLLAISAHTGSDIGFEVIVSDDASSDNSQAILKKIHNLKYKRNKKNLGFLRNCNTTIPDVRGEYVVFLNNDVQVMNGWLDSLLGTFDQFDHVGAVGPVFLYPSGHLQESGATIKTDGTTVMIGLNEDPNQPRFRYSRRVDYCSGACLMMPTELLKLLGGFSDEFAPSYYEDVDLCLKVHDKGYYVYVNPAAKVIHHLSKTMNNTQDDFKLTCIHNNKSKLLDKWGNKINEHNLVRLIAFYLPQFHPIPENDYWWGKGFTEWTNVTKARPNFKGHYQPRLPAELGYYDLRVEEVLEQQAELAKRYGISAFCYYYYWFGGKRLLELPIEKMLSTGKPDMPFCLCWANENWTRRWDGKEQEVLISQEHSDEDDEAVVLDLIRYFRDSRYIRIDDRPLILIYRVSLFPDFLKTAQRWREICRREGIGEIYIAMVESFELVHDGFHPAQFGCDGAVEFPPQGLAAPIHPSGEITNAEFHGHVADYRELSVFYSTRELPSYKRFHGVMPGWDNTARRQNDSFAFEYSTPGAFQAWLEEVIQQTRLQHSGDEQLVFINAWNEWAEGAYLEPDKRFGHTYLEAVKNACDAEEVIRGRGDDYGN
ncbi:glycoside hydrolase family 99-like domain-containing protein [Alicyclobacillus tolerans]|uniref:glycoside hydrolase family 99-like domain-containing protein n=1 Tax=Alicyclobacillus tolerans TaxID=90970 RepID=UPI001F31B975|nr:glycoside hydrolase family 99-like domain-containing protein [Alicyclobacillus tolerans]MCF8567861.1 glycoside hydrolase family 99-like domain-containing protein [Alicyclobacillus tolerans]